MTMSVFMHADTIKLDEETNFTNRSTICVDIRANEGKETVHLFLNEQTLRQLADICERVLNKEHAE